MNSSLLRLAQPHHRCRRRTGGRTGWVRSVQGGEYADQLDTPKSNRVGPISEVEKGRILD